MLEVRRRLQKVLDWVNGIDPIVILIGFICDLNLAPTIMGVVVVAMTSVTAALLFPFVLLKLTLTVILRLNQKIRPKAIGNAPGAKLLRIADFLCSSKSVKLTFEPLIGDLQSEYFEALTKQRIWKARWVRLRYCFAFLGAMGLNKIFSVVKVIKSATW
jgi:hypothetical protein